MKRNHDVYSAHVKDAEASLRALKTEAGDAAGDVKSVVESTRACLGTSIMDCACSTTVNRPVRTRMQGGVGAGGANLPANCVAQRIFSLLPS